MAETRESSQSTVSSVVECASPSSTISPRLHERNRGTQQSPSLFGILMSNSRPSSPEREPLANEPETIKGKNGKKYWLVDQANAENLQICHAVINVTSILTSPLTCRITGFLSPLKGPA
jgi:hypothetical protein